MSEDYKPIGWTEGYIRSLKSVRSALSGDLSGLPEALAGLKAAYSEVKFQEVGTAWSSLNGELYATVVALQSSVEAALKRDNSRFEVIKKEALDFEATLKSIPSLPIGGNCGALGATSTLGRLFTSIAYHVFRDKEKERKLIEEFEARRRKLEEEIKVREDERTEIFNRINGLFDCRNDANDAAQLIREANGEPPPKRPFQPSFCGRTPPPRPAPQPEIAHGKPAPEVIQQRAFVEVNEKLKKVVMQLTITLKIDNRSPITLQTPEMAFPIPPPNKGGRPITPQDGTDAHANFSQKRIGEIFHVSEGEVANWEKGRRKPPFGYSADLRKRGDITEIMSIAETYLKDKELNKKIDAKHKQRYVEGQTENEAGMVEEARHSHREGKY